VRVSVSDLKKLESRVAYTFKNVALLDQSVTHRSFGDRNNERLEFLGDSILNFVVASALFSRFPEAKEGDLSRLRARLVKQQTLAEIARELDLGGFLTMGSGELKSGGFDRDSILSDAVEAIIGAVFLDGGITQAADCVLWLYKERLAALTSSNIEKDAKSRLQEHLQGIGQSVPDYILIGMTGKSPNQNFEIECRSLCFNGIIRAIGTSRRRAEQKAAELALKHLEVIN
jgi:ribonuclease-3|tara:strand:- start:2834 stop:3523 length:690 start_codon:yes stop_codon:yes gene_type:complete